VTIIWHNDLNSIPLTDMGCNMKIDLAKKIRKNFIDEILCQKRLGFISTRRCINVF
jgi:hypothetical protein